MNHTSQEPVPAIIEAEANGESETPILMVEAGPEDTDPTLVRQNAARLLLRFHGRMLAPDAPGIDPWFNLHQTVAAAESPQTAWRTVCVGLIMHPDFYTY